MFKKNKTPVEKPPLAPSLDEIFADIESFEILQSSKLDVSSNADVEPDALLNDNENITLQEWWQLFDEYEQKITKLTAVDETIDAHKQQLQSCQSKLEKTSKKLRSHIHKQQALLKDVV